MKIICYLLSAICWTVIGGCDARPVELPAQESSGICGAAYPGGEDTEENVSYAFSKDAHLPCIDWGSVRRGPIDDPESLYVNMAELFIWFSHGDIEQMRRKFGDQLEDPKAMILALSQEN